MGPKTYKADPQFEKLCRKTVVLLACSEPNCSKYDLMASWGHTESLALRVYRPRDDIGQQTAAK